MMNFFRNNLEEMVTIVLVLSLVATITAILLGLGGLGFFGSFATFGLAYTTCHLLIGLGSAIIGVAGATTIALHQGFFDLNEVSSM